jgi:hypothetical protein
MYSDRSYNNVPDLLLARVDRVFFSSRLYLLIIIFLIFQRDFSLPTNTRRDGYLLRCREYSPRM